MSEQHDPAEGSSSGRDEEGTGRALLTRRRLLRGSVAAATAGSAGCAFDRRETGGTTGPASTEAPSERAVPTTGATSTAPEIGAASPLVFPTGTSPVFEIGRDTGAFPWIVRDHVREEVLSGRASAEDAAIELDLTDVGYYEFCSVTNGVVEVLATFGIVPADPAPEDPLFGLGTDFNRGQALDLLPLVELTGAAVAREGLRWQGGDLGSVEPERGTENFTDGMDRLVEGFESRGIEHLNHLAYNHTDYIPEEVAESVDALPRTVFPHTDEQREGFANYAASVVDHYPEIDHVEVWNEPNFERFSRGPSGTDPEAYRALVKETYEAVTAVRPEVTVIAGSTLGVDVGWHETVMDDGGIEHLDALSIHPYAPTADPVFASGASGESDSLDDLNDTIREFNDGELLPVWITELGWDAIGSELGQARNVVRGYVFAATYENVRSLCLYNFQDVYPGDVPEGMKGLLRHPEDEESMPEAVAPKPSYIAYAVLTRQLAGATFEGADDADVESYEFSRGDETVRVVWAEQERELDLSTESDVTIVSMLGDETSIASGDGSVTVTVGPSPRYVRGETTGIR